MSKGMDWFYNDVLFIKLFSAEDNFYSKKMIRS